MSKNKTRGDDIFFLQYRKYQGLPTNTWKPYYFYHDKTLPGDNQILGAKYDIEVGEIIVRAETLAEYMEKRSEEDLTLFSPTVAAELSYRELRTAAADWTENALAEINAEYGRQIHFHDDTNNLREDCSKMAYIIRHFLMTDTRCSSMLLLQALAIALAIVTDLLVEKNLQEMDSLME